MPRLVVYGRSGPCPDMTRWARWVASHPLAYVEFDIDGDEDAEAKVIAWTGHRSVPTLVIAPDGGFDPIEAPSPLPEGRGPRAIDRGTMLTEPNPGQIGDFLRRHGIDFGGADGTTDRFTEPERTAAGSHAEHGWWRKLI